ncbi:hypothetical protein MMMB2_2869 [Mycobacterium marinum MB2]|nr:hypothetical protein MMMB2_2869 [Mycobacterium marinum MB2]
MLRPRELGLVATVLAATAVAARRWPLIAALGHAVTLTIRGGANQTAARLVGWLRRVNDTA